LEDNPPAQHISKPNLLCQPIGSQLFSGLVCKYAGQAFNKMLILPPFKTNKTKLKNNFA
jgi:hypothetical protein